MRNRRIFAILLALLTILLLTVSAYADQDGNDCWCNSDEYGCWVTDEDGGRSYIMFWSEEARAFFMGGISQPGTLVTRRPETPDGRFGMGPARPRTWRDYLIEMLMRHAGYMEEHLGGYPLESFINDQLYFFETRLDNGDETEESIMSGLKDWDNQLTKEEKTK